MSLSDSAWRTSEVLRLGILEVRAAQPWRINLAAWWPRAILQCMFYVLLGQVLAGTEGREFMFVGGLAVIVMLFTITGVADVPMADKWFETYSRLRIGLLPVASVFLLRAVSWVVEAAIAVLLCLAIVGPLTGLHTLSLSLLPLLPLYGVMMVTSAVAGLAVVAPAVAKRADVFVGNAAAAILTIFSGALIPPGLIGWIDTIGTVLPLRHGLMAVRAALAGDPWLGHLGWEVVVGIGWGVVAWLAYTRQARRARVTGTDDFA